MIVAVTCCVAGGVLSTIRVSVLFIHSVSFPALSCTPAVNSIMLASAPVYAAISAAISVITFTLAVNSAEVMVDQLPI